MNEYEIKKNSWTCNQKKLVMTQMLLAQTLIKVDDLANDSCPTIREYFEFTVQMMNDIQRQYWAHRMIQNETLSTIRLTDEGQAPSSKSCRRIQCLYGTNGGTPDKFNHKNWGRNMTWWIMQCDESSVDSWPRLAQLRIGYTILTLKYDIAPTNVRKCSLMTVVWRSSHAKHLIDQT